MTITGIHYRQRSHDIRKLAIFVYLFDYIYCMANEKKSYSEITYICTQLPLILGKIG
jgi:hypothetical protein